MSRPRRRRTAGHRAGISGRPRLHTEDRRAITVRFAVTPREHACLSARAAAACRLLGPFVREIALGYRPAAPSVPAVNFATLHQLQRLGNNLNQLLVLIYTNRAPLGLLGTLNRLQETVDELSSQLLAEPDRGRPSAKEGDE